MRFGSHVDVTHINLKGVLAAGSTSTVQETVRCTLLVSEAQAFAANMNNTYNPIADNQSQRLIKDQFISVPATNSSPGYPSQINWSMKLKHRQKFSAPAAGTTTNNCLLLIIQSTAVAGTLAPVFQAGLIEVYFKP